MGSQFYAPFSSTCFVVLGLWLVVIQLRYKEWKGDPHMIQRAFGIGLFFSLPGIMTLISLVNPAAPLLWETSYTLVALGGAGIMALLYTAADNQLAAKMLVTLKSLSIRFQYRTMLRPGRTERSFHEHEAIVAAIASHDLDACDAAMAEHLRHVLETLQWAIESQHRQPPWASAVPEAAGHRV